MTGLQVLLKGFAYNVQTIKLFNFSCMLSLKMSGQAEESLAQAAIHQFAEQGNAKAQAKPGAMYLLGSSVEKDEQIPTEYAKRILLTK